MLYDVYPGSSSVVYLVMQTRNLEHGGRRCGFNTKHQRTSSRTIAKRAPGWRSNVPESTCFRVEG